ncbi:hypothetical protein WUBG_04292 [Wuchereria bancrofti]|uniref:Uncharacterized protein n=1 Tax=Wuchereria bancrofti TaxID=6293 RepID=J9EQJ4_WUCBA|nr:hypothetical protein WUBG_04292 [Wuchereria bancrofti]
MRRLLAIGWHWSALFYFLHFPAGAASTVIGGNRDDASLSFINHFNALLSDGTCPIPLYYLAKFYNTSSNSNTLISSALYFHHHQIAFVLRNARYMTKTGHNDALAVAHKVFTQEVERISGQEKQK